MSTKRKSREEKKGPITPRGLGEKIANEKKRYFEQQKRAEKWRGQQRQRC